MSILLSARGLTVSFHKPVLQDLDVEVRDRGILNLMGPCGVGKSTLLRTLSGANREVSRCTISGDVYFRGERLGSSGWPKLVEQKPPLLNTSALELMVTDLPERETLTRAQQRRLVERYLEAMGCPELSSNLDDSVALLRREARITLAILAATMSRPSLLLIDEPTSELDATAAEGVLNIIERLSRDVSIVVVLHNQRHARRLGGTTALLAGGKIHEVAPTETFFTGPTTPAGKDFVRSGSCAVPSPGAALESLDPEQVTRHSLPAASTRQKFETVPFGPSGFRWVERNTLAACPRPGLFDSLDRDLAALRKAGITHIVSLEEIEHIPASEAAAHGMSVLWHPIQDMRATTHAGARKIAEWIAHAINHGGRVAVHCKGGLGRTGTIIAAYLVYRGASPREALRGTRSCDARMIQSQEQERFVDSLSEWSKAGSNEEAPAFDS